MTIANTKWGYFPDFPILKFHRNGKNVTVYEDFSYVRRDGRLITVPAGFFCDGASIPKIAWPIAGSPFTGDNLYPALVHDYLCDLMRKDLCPFASEEVHYMFYLGLKEMGSNEVQARIKWQAVLRFNDKSEANLAEWNKWYGLKDVA